MKAREALHGAWHRVRVVAVRFSAQRGSNLASAIALRGFLALFPILLLAIAVAGFLNASGKDVAEWIISNLGLSGKAAQTVADSVEVAQQTAVTSSIIGIVGLIWTATGLATSIAYCWNTVWRIPGGGLRGRAIGVVWMLGGVVLVAGIAAAAALVNATRGLGPVVGFAAGVVLDVAALLWTAWLLPARRIDWRDMLPAAVLGGVMIEILKAAGALVVPHLVTRSSALYGTLGVVFALIVWMLAFGYVIVITALLEVTRFEERHGTVAITLLAPDVPQHAPRATRRSRDAR